MLQAGLVALAAGVAIVYFTIAIVVVPKIGLGDASSVAIVLVDIDEFKAINDERGHGVGDEVLIGLTRMALSTLRSVDSIARIGGDEFVLLLPETNRAEALAVAERLRVDFGEHLNGAGRVSLSAGIAAFPDDGLDAITLQTRADEALYAAKRGGRNACALAGEGSGADVEAAAGTL